MSRPWMPMYWGDYFADTKHLTLIQHGAYLLMIAHCWQHGRLPESDEARAAICSISLKEWLKIKGTVEAFFRADGTHKRIEKESEKTERMIMQRALAGQRGGFRSGITRAIQADARRRAEATKQTRSKDEAKSNQNGSEIEAKTKLPRTIHKVSIDSSINSDSEIGADPPQEVGEKSKHQVSPSLVRSMSAKGWLP